MLQDPEDANQVAVNAPIKLVLDTNIVLDWLVFDAACLSLFRQRLRDNRVVVLRHPLASAELARVLGYAQLKLEAARQARVQAAYRAQTLPAEVSAEFSRHRLLLPAGFPLCRDRDDEYFLALAYHAKAAALVSRDKAVLDTRRRAEKFAVRIVDVAQLNVLLQMTTPAASLATY